MTDLWIEKYRPNTVEEYVFKSATQKQRVLEWITHGIPHCLFEGKPGTGKCLTYNSKIKINVCQELYDKIMEIKVKKEV